MEGLQVSIEDPQFHSVANSVAKLLETARRELDQDQEAAKASLVAVDNLTSLTAVAVYCLSGPVPGLVAHLKRGGSRYV
jgi:hypothetical protein